MADERRSRILHAISRHGFVQVANLVSELGVSRVTAWRDLDRLSSDGLVKKVRGGATARHNTPAIPRPHDVIGMVIPSADYYFHSIVKGARGVFDSRQMTLSLEVTGYQRDENDRRAVAALLKSGVGGLLLTWPNAAGEYSEQGSWLNSIPVPVVLIERECPAGGLGTTWSVTTAHEDGVLNAVRHVVELGHERIGFIVGGIPALSSRRIRDGWEQAVRVLAPLAEAADLSDLVEGSWPGMTSTDLDALTKAIVDRSITALLCFNDVAAAAIARHVRDCGWIIPDQLSIIAYDDEIAELTQPPLTAVSPPKESLGRLAARALLEILAGEERAPARHIRLEPQLVIRKSTMPPPHGMQS